MCFGKQIQSISVTLDFDDWMVGACCAALRREQEGGGFARDSGGEHKPWSRCCRPGPGIPEKEEKKPSFKKFLKKDLNKYPSVRNCFMEQFCSFSALLEYCSSIIVTVPSSGGAMK